MLLASKNLAEQLGYDAIAVCCFIIALLEHLLKRETCFLVLL
jgi:hypothetical protein